MRNCSYFLPNLLNNNRFVSTTFLKEKERKKREKLLCDEWEGFALISISIIKSIKTLTLFLLFLIHIFWGYAYAWMNVWFWINRRVKYNATCCLPTNSNNNTKQYDDEFFVTFSMRKSCAHLLYGKFFWSSPKHENFLLLFRFLLIFWVCVEQSQFTLKNSL